MKFSPEEELAYQAIKKKVTLGLSPAEHPVAIVLGGQPGAGKSNLYDWANERFDGNIAALDCDAFRRYHPHSTQLVQDAATYGEKTNPFVFTVVDRLVEELSDQKYNMIIESSMKSADTALMNYDLLSPKGYAIEAHIMATSKKESWKGVQDRYELMRQQGLQPRAVPQGFHDYVVDHIADAADEVFRSGKMSNIQVFNRDGDVLYDMQRTPDVSPKAMLQAQIQGIRAAEIQKPEAKKPFYFGKDRRAELRTASAQAKHKPQAKDTPQHGKGTQNIE